MEVKFFWLETRRCWTWVGQHIFIKLFIQMEFTGSGTMGGCRAGLVWSHPLRLHTSWSNAEVAAHRRIQLDPCAFGGNVHMHCSVRLVITYHFQALSKTCFVCSWSDFEILLLSGKFAFYKWFSNDGKTSYSSFSSSHTPKALCVKQQHTNIHSRSLIT